jgi:hypothetical protein
VRDHPGVAFLVWPAHRGRHGFQRLSRDRSRSGRDVKVRKHFGTDGIRGRANGVITPELALRVGQAAASCSSAATTVIAW